MGSETKPAKNVLTKQQRFRLWSELAAMAPEIEAGRLSAAMVAPGLAAKLGHPVTAANVREGAKAAGVALHRRLINRTDGGAYLSVVRTDVEVLKDQVAELRAAVTRLEALLYARGAAPAPNGAR
jgi:hypothetical protein